MFFKASNSLLKDIIYYYNIPGDVAFEWVINFIILCAKFFNKQNFSKSLRTEIVT